MSLSKQATLEKPDTASTLEDDKHALERSSTTTVTTYGAAVATDPEQARALKNPYYDVNLEWTEDEEQKVRRKIDLRLMSFILLTSFVLNMDRTNLCKSKNRKIRICYVSVCIADFILISISKRYFG